MANTKLSTFLIGILDEETNTHGAYKKLGGAIESKVSPEFNTGEVYADDNLKICDNSFKKASITLGILDDDIEIFADILGKTVTEKTVGENTIKLYTSNVNDTAKNVGFGQVIGKKGENNLLYYRTKFYPKVKFKDFETDAKTKGENSDYTTVSIEGTIYPLTNGNWREEADFETLDDAVSFLKSFFKEPAVI